jgi:hypothetical protein
MSRTLTVLISTEVDNGRRISLRRQQVLFDPALNTSVAVGTGGGALDLITE